MIRLKCMLALFSTCLLGPKLLAQSSHYVDHMGSTLEALDPVWNDLHGFYGNSIPNPITVRVSNLGWSMFNPDDDSVTIAAGHYRWMPQLVIAHESAHLGNAQLSNNLSITTPLRFLDEGWASILGYEIGGDGDAYKLYAVNHAAAEHAAEGMSIAKMEDWDIFFGSPPLFEGNYYAYEVGASFAIYLESNYSRSMIRELFEDLGQSGNLDSSLLTVFGRSREVIEREWISWLETVSFEGIPEIVSTVPADEAEGIPSDISEITITFSTAMDPGFICLSTPCERGICYDRATWRDANTLVIPIDRTLEENSEFKIGIGFGTPITCSFKSEEGVWLTPSSLSFKTR